MKDTKPPRETLSSLNYRDAEETPTTTAPELKALSRATLTLLGDVAAGTGENPDDKDWRLISTSPDGAAITVSCTGPDLPAAIPDDTAHPSVIPFERPWLGVYRLTVAAPLVVFDIAWRPDEPLRIMNFSRGNWEETLTALVR